MPTANLLMELLTQGMRNAHALVNENFNKIDAAHKWTRTNIGVGGAPAFATGWSNYDINDWERAHYIETAKEVIIGGLIKPLGGHGNLIFTLPTGLRPAKTLIMPIIADGPTLVRCTVRNSGEVEAPGVALPDFVSLDGIRFAKA